MEKIRTSPLLLTDAVMCHVQNRPHALAYTYLSKEGSSIESINYAELHRRACFVAKLFQQKKLNRERVILLYPTGLDFIMAFLGCLYSGVVAIPVSFFNKENANRHIPWIQKIIGDTKVKAIITTGVDDMAECLKSALSFDKKEVEIINTDYTHSHTSETTGFSPKSISLDSLSHLQYTSGSLSSPKAVMCSHQNLAYSLFETAKVWKYTSKSVTVSWTPHSHVYGLTAGLLVPLYSGSHSILMSTPDFLMDPLLWLKTISSFKATHSGSPNFGYEFCVEELEDIEAFKKLNLSSWQVASSGGESVCLSTLMKFYNKFKSCGFKFESFYPAYGMSECTGLIATPRMRSGPIYCHLDKASFQSNIVVECETNARNDKPSGLAQTVVSCGQPLNGLSLKIVDPVTELDLKPNRMGEVWVRGPMCSQGYWNVSGSVSETSPYIKTGDLGFIKNGELFLVGRLKEIIIIYGKNYYPHDIERDVKDAHPSLSKHNCVAFSAEIDSNEELFVLQEIPDNLSEKEYLSLTASIRRTLSKNQGIDVFAVILVPVNSIPKTATGKIQRKLAKDKYFNQGFQVLYESVKLPA